MKNKWVIPIWLVVVIVLFWIGWEMTWCYICSDPINDFDDSHPCYHFKGE